MHEPGMTTELVTLERARELLATVGPSYRFRSHHFERICTDMRNDDFQSLESIPLVVDTSGRLHNGRHRLAAMLRENKEYTFNINYMTPDAARRWDVVGDNAASWTLADHLRMEGVKDATAISASLSYLHRFRTGGIVSRLQPTRSQALRLLSNNEDLIKFLSSTRGVSRGFRISGGMCAATAYLTSLLDGVDSDDISEFWSLLEGLASSSLETVAATVSEAESGAGTALVTYATWLRKTMPSRHRAVNRSQVLTWAFLIKTWNAYITSGSSERLRLAPKERFPALASATGILLYPGSDEAMQLTGGEPV